MFYWFLEGTGRNLAVNHRMSWHGHGHVVVTNLGRTIFDTVVHHVDRSGVRNGASEGGPHS